MSGPALGGEAEPWRYTVRRDVALVDSAYVDLEAAERRCGGGFEGGVDGVEEARGRRRRSRAAVEDEFRHRHAGPDTSPVAREDAGARGGCGGRQAAEDDVQNLVGEGADEVLRAAAVDGGRLHGKGSG